MIPWNHPRRFSTKNKSENLFPNYDFAKIAYIFPPDSFELCISVSYWFHINFILKRFGHSNITLSKNPKKNAKWLKKWLIKALVRIANELKNPRTWAAVLTKMWETPYSCPQRIFVENRDTCCHNIKTLVQGVCAKSIHLYYKDLL